MGENRFIERQVMGALSFFKESLFADEVASRKGFLQARDPRVKTLMILMALLAVLFSKSILFITSVYGLCFGLAVLSSINVVFFLKRTWLFIPLFSLCVALPALFSIFTPGEPLVSFRLFVVTVSITKQGVASAAIFLLRVVTSVSLCVLLALTTRHYALLRVLRVFRMPQVFVMTIGMCYRYVYLFIGIIQDTHMAIKSRAGTVSSSTKGRRMVAWNIAGLWNRSYELHGQVYGAMISRGYDGEPKTMEDFHVTTADIACLGMAVALFLGSLWQTSFTN